MIRPPGFNGAAFTTAADGDMWWGDRVGVSASLGIEANWATVRQVHGSVIVEVELPGEAGEADALVTETVGLPLAVFTADCAGVILEGDSAVAVAHGGWRGAAEGSVAKAAARLERFGPVLRAALGPTIGPCCFEVGSEVADAFADHVATTDWGTTSVDLPAVIRAQVTGVSWWSADACTKCGDGFFSHRANKSDARMAAVTWLP